jgi:hypothetical protein
VGGVVMGLSEYIFDWKNPKISTWKKCLRITFLHNFNDIECRGSTAQQIAMMLLARHEKELKEDELEFIKGLLK